MILHAARHEWPSGARFLFNLCRHHSVLTMRGETAKMTITLHSKEGVTQGYPSSMIGYAILILPLIERLKLDHVNGDSIWHADDGNAIGNLDTINSFFKRLCEIGPSFGYYPEESKNILIVKERDASKATYFCAENDLPFNIGRGSRHL